MCKRTFAAFYNRNYKSPQASASSSTGRKNLWANLLAGPQDVDVGIHSTLYSSSSYAPYYHPSDVYIHERLRRRESTEQSVPSQCGDHRHLSLGVSTSGATWTKNPSLGTNYDISVNANFYSDGQSFKVSALHTGTIPFRGFVHLGHFTIAANKITATSTADDDDHLGQVTVSVLALQSSVSPSAGTATTDASAFTAIAGTANIRIGSATLQRRRLRRLSDDEYAGPIGFVDRTPPPNRRLQSTCDPCVTNVYGDANGDCILDVTDANAILNMFAIRTSFVLEQTTVDPLDSVHNCSFTREQYNPLYNYISGITDPNSTLYQRHHVGVSDAIHVLRATAANARFIVPSMSCVSGHASPRPDVLIESEVYVINPTDQTTMTPSVSSTDIYFDLLITGTPNAQYSPQFFNVSGGDIVRQGWHPGPRNDVVCTRRECDDALGHDQGPIRQRRRQVDRPSVASQLRQ